MTHQSYEMFSPDVACPLCLGTYSSFRHVAGAFYYYCPSCEVFFLAPQPSVALLDKYYSIMHENYGGAGRSYLAGAGRLKKDFSAKKAIVERFSGQRNSRRRLLDFGCAYGLFVSSLEEDRYDAVGFDVSAEAIARARELAPHARFAKTMDEMRREEGTFDCVTLWATIEHVPDPRSVLDTAHRMLGDGGIVVLDTGIANDWLSRAIRGNVQWFDAPQHLWVFTVNGMKKVLADIGFSLVYVDARFERTQARRIAKLGFSMSVAVATRVINRVVSLDDRKIPVGNLGLWVARKTG